MKHQRTEWIWNYTALKGTYVRVGWIHNKQRGVVDDKIRVQIHSLHTDLDFNMRIDEAFALVGGIGKVMCRQAIRDRIKVT